MGIQNPTKEQFRALYQLAMGIPVLMLNLIKLHETAQYQADDSLRPTHSISSKDAYKRYSAEAQSVFNQVGGKQHWISNTLATLTGKDHENWDLAFLAYYPSVTAFIEMVKSPAYQHAARHRAAAVAESRPIVCKQIEAGESFALQDWTN